MFFRFPPAARWNPERNAVEFGIGVGEYEGVIRVSRRVFEILLSEAPTLESCLEAFHLHRTERELIAERKVRRWQLTDDGSRDYRSRSARTGKLGTTLKTAWQSPGSIRAMPSVVSRRQWRIPPTPNCSKSSPITSRPEKPRCAGARSSACAFPVRYG